MDSIIGARISPQVSVIMPVYNGEPYLREAVESILNQTFTDFEFIVINDGSTDGTRAILECYSDPRLVLAHQENRGLVASLNRGLTLARGVFIARQDADDVSLPGRLEAQVHFLDAHPRVGLAGTSYAVIGEDGRELDVVSPPTSNAEIQSALLDHNCLCHGSVMFRRACLDTVGVYRPELLASEDYDLWLRVAERFQVACLDTVLYRWRFTPGSRGQMLMEEESLIDQLVQLHAANRRTGVESWSNSGLNELKPEPRRVVEKLLRHAYLAHVSGDTEATQSALVRATRAEPHLYDTDQFRMWMVNCFVHLTHRGKPLEHAEQFVVDVLRVVLANQDIHQRRTTRRRLMAHCYVATAFQNYTARQMSSLRANLVRALWRDPHWIGNRGVLSIGVEAMLGRRLANRLRGIPLRRVLRPRVPDCTKTADVK